MTTKRVVVLLLICMLLTMAVAPAFGCTGYDPCPDGAYGNGDPNMDAIGWVQTLMDAWSWLWQ